MDDLVDWRMFGLKGRSRSALVKETMAGTPTQQSQVQSFVVANTEKSKTMAINGCHVFLCSGECLPVAVPVQALGGCPYIWQQL